ncbi:jg940, partial [Pararge aegeria aegeria]
LFKINVELKPKSKEWNAAYEKREEVYKEKGGRGRDSERHLKDGYQTRPMSRLECRVLIERKNRQGKGRERERDK